MSVERRAQRLHVVGSVEQLPGSTPAARSSSDRNVRWTPRRRAGSPEARPRRRRPGSGRHADDGDARPRAPRLTPTHSAAIAHGSASAQVVGPLRRARRLPLSFGARLRFPSDASIASSASSRRPARSRLEVRRERMRRSGTGRARPSARYRALRSAQAGDARAPSAASGRPGRRSCRAPPTRSSPSTSCQMRRDGASPGPSPARRTRRRAGSLGARARGALRGRLAVGVSGSASRATKPRAPCTRAARVAQVRAQLARVGAGVAAGHDVRDEPLVAGASSRADDRALAHPGVPRRHASISPSSMRKPRTFTWWSARPRNSSSPSARQRAMSPVRYSRAAGRRRERVGHEALRGQVGVVQVAARDAGAADAQLARHARRRELAGARRARRAACWRSARRSARRVSRPPPPSMTWRR